MEKLSVDDAEGVIDLMGLDSENVEGEVVCLCELLEQVHEESSCVCMEFFEMMNEMTVLEEKLADVEEGFGGLRMSLKFLKEKMRRMGVNVMKNCGEGGLENGISVVERCEGFGRESDRGGSECSDELR